MKVWIVRGEHPVTPGCPMIACASRDAADREAAGLVAVICRDYDIPPPAAPQHWREALADVQDRIVKEQDIELDDEALDPDAEIAAATGCDVWIDELEVVQ